MASSVEQFAAAEPQAYSVDTRLRLANALGSDDPAKAAQLEREARGLLFSVRDPEVRGRLSVTLVERLLDVGEAQEAEIIARDIASRRSAGTAKDYQAECYDRLIRYWAPREKDEAIRLLNDAAASGAFLMESGRRALEVLRDEDPSQAQAMFGRMLTTSDIGTEYQAFPFIQCVAEIAPVDTALAKAAIDRLLRTIDTPQFNRDSPYELTMRDATRRADTTREVVLWRLGRFLATADSSLASGYRQRLGSWLGKGSSAEEVHGIRYKGEREDRDELWQELPELSPAEALEQVRGITDTAEKVEMLIYLSTARTDFTQAERTECAIQALREAPGMHAGFRKLDAIDALRNAFLKWKDTKQASEAARLFAQATRQLCSCRSASCDPGRVAARCLDVYEYAIDALIESDLDPLREAASDPSVMARVLLRQLQPKDQ